MGKDEEEGEGEGPMMKFPALRGCLNFPRCVFFSVLCGPHMKLNSLSLISMKSLLGTQWAWGRAQTMNPTRVVTKRQTRLCVLICIHSVTAGFEA